MKKSYIIAALFLMLTASGFADSLRFGSIVNYYNEPALKPGVTVGFDTQWDFHRKWSLGLTAPCFTYFRFPLNYESWSLYPEISIRRTGEKGFYWAFGFGSGISWSRKIVPVYNLSGYEIDAPFTRQLILTAQMYFGYDFKNRDWPVKLYLSLGWKGLYPNNLKIQNQPMLQLGVNYGFRRIEL